ncbi:MAG TPA: fumarylacetoacetase [candidate division Zixibacteria bacterium]|nr:fumarylacetoacetase [candidate division Zixibacteria bacterium]
MTLTSFIEVPADSHFPIQNLPYGVFSTNGETPRVGVRIGTYVLDLSVLEAAGLLPQSSVFAQSSLNAFMAQGREAWRTVRSRLQELLASDNPTLRDHAEMRRNVLTPVADVTLHLPVEIGDYTDFYSSKEHATNMGTMFRGKDNALMPNWLYIPVAYHGRASSVVLSGTDVYRPYGQIKPEDGPPVLAPSRVMDFELEMGYFIGTGNELGTPIPVDQAADHFFGMVLVNDWSARDIQRWEYQPLGPFLAKNMATSISPWVVPLDALEPFRCAAPPQDPAPLSYLDHAGDQAYDINLEVLLQSESMTEPMSIARSNFKYMYWHIAQQLAHHTITGCNMRPGDMMASGTLSGPTPDTYGSMLEITWRGENPLELTTGETRKFLQDGDRLTITGWAQGDGYQVGFGEVVGRVMAPRTRMEHF